MALGAAGCMTKGANRRKGEQVGVYGQKTEKSMWGSSYQGVGKEEGETSGAEGLGQNFIFI